MATGGGLEQSIDKGCDEYFEYCCTPCSADGKNAEAFNFCVKCNEYLCFKCLQDHNRFGQMKAHQILDKAGMKAQGPQQNVAPPTEICQLHHGNIIDTYCGGHDDVCCGTCVSLVHRACHNMEYLPLAAKGIKKSKEYKDLKSSMQNIQLQLDNMKQLRQNELKALAKEKNTALTQMKDLRKTVMKRLDELEKITIDELQAKHQAFQAKINSDIKRLEEVMKVIETNSKKLETFTGDNESQLFVYVKTGKKTATDGSKLIQEMKTGHERNALKLRINASIDDFLKTQTSMGDIQEVPRVYSAFLYGEYDMSRSGDKYTCNIGSCQLVDGSVLVTDYSNQKLIRLGSSYQVRDHCYLPGYPCAVCATGPQEVVVTLNEVVVTLNKVNKVQFVALGDTMTLKKSFSVKCKYLHGVAYTKDQLFLSTWDPDAIYVYNKSGTRLKSIKKDTTDQNMFTDPRHIALSNDCSKIHIADWGQGVVTLSIKGDKQSQFTDPELNAASGVCVGNNDEMLVCGKDTHNILQISRDGRKLGVIFEQKDGIKSPQSLCWDRVNSRLIVTFYSNDHIKVFNLVN